MKVGILGSGDVAKALAAGFLQHEHEVTLGTRSPEKLASWVAAHPKARVASFADSAQSAELVVLAVKGSASADALRAAGAENIAGKVVIDATNPITDDPPDHGVLRFFTDINKSLLERLQKEFPSALLVKAFSCVGSAQMVNPQFAGGKPTMFICGDDASAKQKVRQILDQFGWETADMGHAPSARAIEPLCMLWCARGFLQNQWKHAFKLLT